MVEVRKYCCCTNNLTACKIVGGVQIALNAIVLTILLWFLNQFQGNDRNHAMVVAAVVASVFGVSILCNILLVIAASKRNATMLMVWIVLNGICLGLHVIGLFFIFYIYYIGSFTCIGIGIWAELIAIGAWQEVKSGVNIA